MTKWMYAWPLTAGLVCAFFPSSAGGIIANETIRDIIDIDWPVVSSLRYDIEVPAVQSQGDTQSRKLFRVKETRVFQSDHLRKGTLNFTRKFMVNDDGASTPLVTVTCTVGTVQVVETQSDGATNVFISVRVDDFPATVEVEYNMPALWRHYQIPATADLAIWPWRLYHTSEFWGTAIRSNMPSDRLQPGLVMPIKVHSPDVHVYARITHQCSSPPRVERACNMSSTSHKTIEAKCVDFGSECVGFQVELFNGDTFLKHLPDQCIDAFHRFAYDDTDPRSTPLSLLQFYRFNPIPCFITQFMVSVLLCKHTVYAAHLAPTQNLSFARAYAVLLVYVICHYVVFSMYLSLDMFYRMRLGSCLMFFQRMEEWDRPGTKALWLISLLNYVIYPMLSIFVLLLPFRWMARRLLNMNGTEAPLAVVEDGKSSIKTYFFNPYRQEVIPEEPLTEKQMIGVQYEETKHTLLDFRGKTVPACPTPSPHTVSRDPDPVLPKWLQYIVTHIHRCMSYSEDVCVLVNALFHVTLAVQGVVPDWMPVLYLVAVVIFYRFLYSSKYLQ